VAFLALRQAARPEAAGRPGGEALHTLLHWGHAVAAWLGLAR